MESNTEKMETIQTRVVLPTDLNDKSALFGGKALQWMDEVSYIVAKRFTKTKTVTIGADKVQFLATAHVGDIIEIKGKVEGIVGLKIKIRIEVYAEDPVVQTRKKIITGLFIFIAVNENNKPLRIAQ